MKFNKLIGYFMLAAIILISGCTKSIQYKEDSFKKYLEGCVGKMISLANRGGISYELMKVGSDYIVLGDYIIPFQAIVVLQAEEDGDHKLYLKSTLAGQGEIYELFDSRTR